MLVGLTKKPPRDSQRATSGSNGIAGSPVASPGRLAVSLHGIAVSEAVQCVFEGGQAAAYMSDLSVGDAGVQ
jgi:hypothetical protein